MPVSHEDLYAESWNRNFCPNPFEKNVQNVSQNTEETEYVLIEVSEDNHPRIPEISKKNRLGAQ